MILDTLSRNGVVRQWLPDTAAGFDFLLRSATPDLAEGRHAIDGERVFALVQRYTTHEVEKSLPEAHRRYLDIQYMIAGRETVYWTPLTEAGAVAEPYAEPRDIEFFEHSAMARRVDLMTGSFCLLLPDDVHQPCCRCEMPEAVHKVVVKVRL